MGIYEYLWKYVDLYGYEWVVDMNCIWIFMDIYVYVWIYMDRYGHLWTFMGIYGYIYGYL